MPLMCILCPSRTSRWEYERVAPCNAHLQLYDLTQAPTIEEFACIIDEFSVLSPKQLANAIWNVAKQGSAPSKDFMDAIAAEVHTKLGQFR